MPSRRVAGPDLETCRAVQLGLHTETGPALMLPNGGYADRGRYREHCALALDEFWGSNESCGGASVMKSASSAPATNHFAGLSRRSARGYTPPVQLADCHR